MANAKQQAPPPPVGFTGEVPRPGLGQKVHDHIRKRRAERRARPRTPLVMINTMPAPQKRRRRATRLSRSQSTFGMGGNRPTARRARRRPPRRGTLFAVLSVAVAAAALTMAVVEFASWSAATGMFAAAEGVSFGTAWFFGDPSPRPDKPPPTPRKPRAAGNPPKGSGGHRCGAPTEDGSPCQNPVSNSGDKCWRHPGGGAATKAKTAPTKTAGPKRTKKAAPPPAATP
jgi:hypothetical protein